MDTIKNTNIIEEILSRGVVEAIDKETLRKKLMSGQKLRVKLGIDPTSPNLHLGRSIPLLKLKDLQDLGHQIVFIIGDFTGVIGDTSDKESERPMLTEETVEKNLEKYLEQVGKILDLSKVETYRNSEWLGKLGYKEIAEQANVFSLAEFIARENIKNRIEKGKRISLREVMYPLMQGYDSVMVKSDIELGGSDQRFNILSGRELQRHYKQEPQSVILMNLIEGLDGRKMSSSWGNTINLLDDPQLMFGKIMSMGDDLIEKYFIHCTRVPMEKIESISQEMKAGTLNPRDAKLDLAEELVKMYHGEIEAQKAKEYFINTFSKKEIPTEISEIAVGEKKNILDYIVAVGFAVSKGDARRKLEQGGVSIDGEKISEDIILDETFQGKVLKVGKKDFVKIKF